MAGLVFHLREGNGAQPVKPRLDRAQGRRLTEEETRRILDRIPPLAEEAGESALFAFPPESPPPPRPGRTVDQAFPPPMDPAPPEPDRDLEPEVSRRSPEGEVPRARNLSLTFTRPMVALSGLGDQASMGPPVRLLPEPPGAWRWVGTRTLVFEPDFRFPMATEYRVEVPAGTQSATGARLKKPVRWKFRTPPPKVELMYPGKLALRSDWWRLGVNAAAPDRFRCNPVVFLRFDQDIEPEAVLATIGVQAGGRTWPLRMAGREEIRADETVRRLARESGGKRWLAFRARDVFPNDTEVSVFIGPGTPSAEGPLKTEKAEKFHFNTHGAPGGGRGQVRLGTGMPAVGSVDDSILQPAG